MLKIDRRLIAHFDWPLLAVTLLLLGVGLITLLSASHTPDRLFSSYILRQAVWAAAGLLTMFLAVSFDYRLLDRYSFAVYGVCLFLLLAVALVGAWGGGARRWLALGPVALQPSEFTKVAIVVLLASILQREVGERRLRHSIVLLCLVVVAVPTGLILKQPDLGTALILVFVGGGVLLVGGMPLRWGALGGAVFLAIVPHLWHHLKPYQQRRIQMYFNPDLDPLRYGYHIIQSKIAIGSGMVSGKGYLHGTQNRLNFLPEQHTDFIFSVFAEEWGFMGACVLMGLYAFLLLRCFVVISRARDSFGVLLAFGLTAVIFSQVLINIGMASGALPVVGVTLPFFSYGGSSLLVCCISIGLLLNISMRRFTF